MLKERNVLNWVKLAKTQRFASCSSCSFPPSSPSPFLSLSALKVSSPRPCLSLSFLVSL